MRRIGYDSKIYFSIAFKITISGQEAFLNVGNRVFCHISYAILLICTLHNRSISNVRVVL